LNEEDKKDARITYKQREVKKQCTDNGCQDRLDQGDHWTSQADGGREGVKRQRMRGARMAVQISMGLNI